MYDDCQIRWAPDCRAFPDSEGLMNILLAEDDNNFARYLIRELEAEAHTVEWAANGVDAVAQSMRKPFDAVILDYRMPRLDGLYALRLMKLLRPHLPIIAYSGSASPEDREALLNQGAAAFLAKPFPLEELKLALHRFRIAPPVPPASRPGQGSGV
jgi:DNA-binding response OmpR family regulator